jgi:YD repeat-containing protein
MSKDYVRHPQLRGNVIFAAAADTPANATDPNTAQPAGAKFIGFGENVSSGAVNRAVGAVQKNVDILHSLAFGEVAVPKVIDCHLDLQAGETTLVVDDPGGAALRVYVDDSAPSPAGESGIFQILDKNFNEITNVSGTICQITDVEFTENVTDLSGGVAIQLTDAMGISALTRHTVKTTLGAPAYPFNQAPGAKVGNIHPRPACPGDTVVIAGNHAGNNTNVGTLDWVVHKVISDREVEVRCVQDPSRPLDLSNPAVGTAQLMSNGSFFVNPTITLNFNPKDDGGVPALEAIYLVFGYSKQPISSVAVPAAATYPFDTDTFMKVSILAAEEEENVTDQLNISGLDEAYDKRFGPKQDNALGSGRKATVDNGAVQLVAGGAGTGDPHGAVLETDLEGTTAEQVGYLTKSKGKDKWASFLTSSEPTNATLLSAAAEISGGGGDVVYPAPGEDLTNVVPFATIATITVGGGGNPNDNGVYLVVRAIEGADTLSLKQLDGQDPNNGAGWDSANGQVIAVELRELRVWADAYNDYGFSASHADTKGHVLQLAGSSARQDVLRTLHRGTGQGTHVSCFSGGNDQWEDGAAYGASNQLDFQVTTAGDARIRGKLVNRFTEPADRYLNLDEGGAGKQIKLHLQVSKAGDADLDSRAHMLLQASGTPRVEFTLQNKVGGGAVQFNVLGVHNSDVLTAKFKSVGNAEVLSESTAAALVRAYSLGGGTAQVKVQADDGSLEAFASTNWMLTGDAAETEQLSIKFQVGGVKEAARLYQPAALQSVFAVGPSAVDLSADGVPADGHAMRLSLGRLTDPPQVEAFWDTRSGGAADDRIQYIKDDLTEPGVVGGATEPNRFLSLGHESWNAAHETGGVTMFTLMDNGFIDLGFGAFHGFLRKGDVPFRLDAGSKVIVESLNGTDRVTLGEDGEVVATKVTATTVATVGVKDEGVVPSTTLMITNNPADTETVTIGGDVYEWDSGGGVGGGNIAVTIGGDEAASAVNLQNAINAAGENVLAEKVTIALAGIEAVIVSNADAPGGVRTPGDLALAFSETMAGGGNYWTVPNFSAADGKAAAQRKRATAKKILGAEEITAGFASITFPFVVAHWTYHIVSSTGVPRLLTSLNIDEEGLGYTLGFDISGEASIILNDRIYVTALGE